jgi:hypothetical protein
MNCPNCGLAATSVTEERPVQRLKWCPPGAPLSEEKTFLSPGPAMRTAHPCGCLISAAQMELLEKLLVS